MTDQPDPQVFASVADYDQHHAEAIDWLRQAQTFLLAVPRQDDDSDQWRIVMTGGGVDFDAFLPAIAASFVAMTDDVNEQVERSLRRSRQARRWMVAIAGLNLAVAAFSLSRLMF